MSSSILGRVENGPVSTETNQHIRMCQFLLQIGKLQMSGQVGMVSVSQLKGQTKAALRSHSLQNALSLLSRFHPTVTVWIGT